MAVATTNATATRVDATLLAAVAAFILGAGLVFGVGFTSPMVLHNATHDARHAAGFPCH